MHNIRSCITYFDVTQPSFFDEINSLIFHRDQLLSEDANHIIFILAEIVGSSGSLDFIHLHIARSSIVELSRSLAIEHKQKCNEKKITTMSILSNGSTHLSEQLITSLEVDSGIHRFNGQSWSVEKLNQLYQIMPMIGLPETTPSHS